MSAHSPGPWEWDAEKRVLSGPNPDVGTYSYPPNPARVNIIAVCEDCGWGPDNPVDARLIAAAPEMLALLRDVATEVLPHEYGDLAERAQALLDRIDKAVT